MPEPRLILASLLLFGFGFVSVDADEVENPCRPGWAVHTSVVPGTNKSYVRCLKIMRQPETFNFTTCNLDKWCEGVDPEATGVLPMSILNYKDDIKFAHKNITPGRYYIGTTVKCGYTFTVGEPHQPEIFVNSDGKPIDPYFFKACVQFREGNYRGRLLALSLRCSAVYPESNKIPTICQYYPYPEEPVVSTTEPVVDTTEPPEPHKKTKKHKHAKKTTRVNGPAPADETTPFNDPDSSDQPSYGNETTPIYDTEATDDPSYGDETDAPNYGDETTPGGDVTNPPDVPHSGPTIKHDPVGGKTEKPPPDNPTDSPADDATTSDAVSFLTVSMAQFAALGFAAVY